jgi:RecB family endonuclease NucS
MRRFYKYTLCILEQLSTHKSALAPRAAKVRGNYVAMIFVDRVVHMLEELFGLDKSKVASIREDLEAGRPAHHIEVQALRTQLIQAEFIPG